MLGEFYILYIYYILACKYRRRVESLCWPSFLLFLYCLDPCFHIFVALCFVSLGLVFDPVVVILIL